MFNFSSKTYVNKEFKVSDFLKQIKASKEVREDAKKINNIYFLNVINAHSLNSEEEKNYKNIYVIKIVLNSPNIPKLFMDELDKNIAFHTYFIYEYDNEVSTYIAYKEIGNKIKVLTKYYYHDFHKEVCIKVPSLNSVSKVYKLILEYEIGIKSKDDEEPTDYISRVNKINKLKFQISKTEQAIRFESQPKKKFEYNDRLRKYKEELKNLL